MFWALLAHYQGAHICTKQFKKSGAFVGSICNSLYFIISCTVLYRLLIRGDNFRIYFNQ